MNDTITAVVENLISRHVIKKTENNSLELTDRFSRLQCSKCFYISYLNSNEPMNCLRCSSVELYDFQEKVVKFLFNNTKFLNVLIKSKSLLSL